jgi:hypothetical protein
LFTAAASRRRHGGMGIKPVKSATYSGMFNLRIHMLSGSDVRIFANLLKPFGDSDIGFLFIFFNFSNLFCLAACVHLGAAKPADKNGYFFNLILISPTPSSTVYD